MSCKPQDKTHQLSYKTIQEESKSQMPLHQLLQSLDRKGTPSYEYFREKKSHLITSSKYMHIILFYYCSIKQNCVCVLPDRSINTLLSYTRSQSKAGIVVLTLPVQSTRLFVHGTARGRVISSVLLYLATALDCQCKTLP